MGYRIIAIIAVPLLGYASYLALILSEVYRKKKYAQHLVIENAAVYGPMLPAIEAKQWYNGRILLSWLGIGCALFVLYWFRQPINSYVSFDFFDFVMGIYLTIVLLGLCSALRHFLTYRYAASEPSSLTGQATLSSTLIHYQLAYQMLSFTLLLVGITAYQPTSFLVGSVLVSLMVAFSCWNTARVSSYKKLDSTL